MSNDQRNRISVSEGVDVTAWARISPDCDMELTYYGEEVELTIGSPPTGRFTLHVPRGKALDRLVDLVVQARDVFRPRDGGQAQPSEIEPE
jgi:hypothetical protein